MEKITKEEINKANVSVEYGTYQKLVKNTEDFFILKDKTLEELKERREKGDCFFYLPKKHDFIGKLKK